MQPIDPPAIRYIKLGSGGAWSDLAFERGLIPLGFADAPHDLCAAGDWDDVIACLVAEGRSPAAAAQDVRELKDFYDLPSGSLWITFADGHLNWALAGSDIKPGKGDAPPRYRSTLSGWHRTNIAGHRLAMNELSSALTKTASYRRTICTVASEGYLLRKINDETDPLVERAGAIESQLTDVASQMIAGLHWRDFELLIDLLFARCGWQRISAAGDGEVDIDLLLEQPMTGERAWVQIKSVADQTELDDYIDRFERDGSASQFFFVCHSPRSELVIEGEDVGHYLLTGSSLASKVIQSGLLGWLQNRTG